MDQIYCYMDQPISTFFFSFQTDLPTRVFFWYPSGASFDSVQNVLSQVALISDTKSAL